METLWHDLRYGARMLLKKPGFTLIAVITLALGIGANAAIFSVVNAVLLRPLPYPQPERLVTLRDLQPPNVETGADYAEFLDWREQNNVFESVGAYFNTEYSLTGRGEPEQVWAQRVSSGLLPLLGVTPLLGRHFTPEEDHPKAQPVALISHSLWQRRFGGDPQVVGSSVTLSSRSYTVVGVLPPSFRYVQSDDMTSGQGREVWVPLRLDTTTTPRGFHFLRVLGRLRPGVTLEQARREMNLLAERLKKERSITHGVLLFGLQGHMVRDARRGLLLLLAAVGMVLLIGCANVANLLLARAATRQREMAVRLALGAGPRRLIRQLLTESMLLALLGGSLGVGLAVWLMEFLARSVQAQIPRVEEVSLDGTVLLFTLGISLLTGVLFGLWPALRSTRSDLFGMLKEGGAKQGAGSSRDGARSFLVVSEVALSMVLLIAAGLVINSFIRLLHVSKGFDPDHVLTFGLAPSSMRYPESRQQSQLFGKVLERVSVLPGVEAVGAVSELPLGNSSTNGDFRIEGRNFPPNSGPIADKRMASEDYFRALHIQLLSGRYFTPQDRPGAPQVAIVNVEFVRRFFPNENPIGKRIDFGWDTTDWQEIVGVVDNVRHERLDVPSAPEIYLPYQQRTPGGMSIVVRTAADPVAMAHAVRQQVYLVDEEQSLSQLRTMEKVVSESVSNRLISLILYGSFAGLALLLASIGIYGVMSYAVAQRTHEIGIRMALGAMHRDVLKLVLKQGGALALMGIALGLIASLALMRLMEGLLFGVSATDPLTFVVVASVLTAVALLACWIPARRATKVDPLVALRYE